MADVATDIDGEVTTDGAGGGGKGVGGTEDGWQRLVRYGVIGASKVTYHGQS